MEGRRRPARGDLRAILAAAMEVDVAQGGTGKGASEQRPLLLLQVRLVRQQRIGLVENVLRGVAEQALGGLVPQQDIAPRRQRENGERGGIDHRAQCLGSFMRYSLGGVRTAFSGGAVDV